MEIVSAAAMALFLSSPPRHKVNLDSFELNIDARRHEAQGSVAGPRASQAAKKERRSLPFALPQGCCCVPTHSKPWQSLGNASTLRNNRGAQLDGYRRSSVGRTHALNDRLVAVEAKGIASKLRPIKKL